MSAQPPQPTITGPSRPETPQRRPQPTVLQSQDNDATMRPDANKAQPLTKKKRNHRGGKKKRTRRQSFALHEEGPELTDASRSRPGEDLQSVAKASFYRLQGRNHSNTSLDSEALLDHREQQNIRPRRQSMMGSSAFGVPIYETPSSYRPQYQNPFTTPGKNSNNDREDDIDEDERAPLIPSSSKSKSSGATFTYGGANNSRNNLQSSHRRASSKSSSRSRKKNTFDRPTLGLPLSDSYNVNYPPSVPGSPTLSATNRNMSFGDLIDLSNGRDDRDIFSESAIDDRSIAGSATRRQGRIERRSTIALDAEGDVCFPVEGMSEMADDEMAQRDGNLRHGNGLRRKRSKWPHLSMLDEWSRFEKEGRSDERRAKKITEPQLIGGRLRPIHRGWHRAEDDAPYRFTYFNEEFQSTIHSQTISELVQPGGSFKELFIPDRPVLEDSSESEDDEEESDRKSGNMNSQTRHVSGMGALDGGSRAPTRQGSIQEQKSDLRRGGSVSLADTESKAATSGEATPSGGRKSPAQEKEKPKRYGDRPTWWLDVLSPTEAEMKVLCKTFGIHPLTAEDIMMQEAREKVELFGNYYFVNYRSFEQDMNNEDFLEPVNMYVVVFREGVISFHFSLTPHPANVRRRIRQLKDYLILSSDWISYAIIDDITDVFAPLIQNIEDEVDDIDDAILQLHSQNPDGKLNKDEKQGDGDGTSGESGGDMLRRVGDCRKKVMGLYRLLGNKADVIKGFAKRCNEHWEVAPRSEIGLYLGDIQDHIVTMTGNLSHYEKILARSHGNYLAQINIRMNERQEQTADVLGRLTVLGTIVLPMNIITGLWGMNVWVPGQDYEGDLTWFWCLTAGLLAFGFTCFFLAKKVYKIV
ncbi:hypothetical protein HYFRA_00012839 [Hymenoscyphus fraxineus]|uniref:Cora-domain-containing protein n=1 Tax=Hymenoscyphus fraxineus TaxID=746836 RepID=A0A9N9PM05_9HELO|nr:hypothetical protein HYFRA_00012839 [Hymenoscyphus fraxineus]